MTRFILPWATRVALQKYIYSPVAPYYPLVLSSFYVLLLVLCHAVSAAAGSLTVNLQGDRVRMTWLPISFTYARGVAFWVHLVGAVTLATLALHRVYLTRKCIYDFQKRSIDFFKGCPSATFYEQHRDGVTQIPSFLRSSSASLSVSQLSSSHVDSTPSSSCSTSFNPLAQPPPPPGVRRRPLLCVAAFFACLSLFGFLIHAFVPISPAILSRLRPCDHADASSPRAYVTQATPGFLQAAAAFDRQAAANDVPDDARTNEPFHAAEAQRLDNTNGDAENPEGDAENPEGDAENPEGEKSRVPDSDVAHDTTSILSGNAGTHRDVGVDDGVLPLQSNAYDEVAAEVLQDDTAAWAHELSENTDASFEVPDKAEHDEDLDSPGASGNIDAPEDIEGPDVLGRDMELFSLSDAEHTDNEVAYPVEVMSPEDATDETMLVAHRRRRSLLPWKPTRICLSDHPLYSDTFDDRTMVHSIGIVLYITMAFFSMWVYTVWIFWRCAFKDSNSAMRPSLANMIIKATLSIFPIFHHSWFAYNLNSVELAGINQRIGIACILLFVSSMGFEIASLRYGIRNLYSYVGKYHISSVINAHRFLNNPAAGPEHWN